MNKFSHYFSFEKYHQMASYHQGQNQNISSDIYQSLEEEMAQSLNLFLKDYNKEYTLKPFINDDTHQTNFNYFWNDYISTTSTQEESEINREIQLISDKLFFWHQVGYTNTLKEILNKKENKEEKEKSLFLYYQKSYDEFVDLITTGDISRKYDLSEEYCFHCGRRFKIEFKNWTPVFIDRTFVPEPSSPIGQKTLYFEAEPCYKEYVSTIPITFKTGNLLISDWFRIPEFTNFVDDKCKFDINCSKGKLELATYLATNFNVMSAPSYGSPHILQKNDRIIFAEYPEDYDEDDEDEEEMDNDEIKENHKHNNQLETYLDGYEYKDRANSGLRNVTIIEKEQLIDLIFQSGKTLKEAQLIVETYIEENDMEIQSLTVTPGVYNFKFAGNCDYFKEYTQQEENFPEQFNPFCIIENTQLSLNKKMKI